MSDDVMKVVRVPIGSLAARLYHAEQEYIRADRQLEQLLTSLYPSFSGYEFGPDGIDIYEAIASEASAGALFRAGFAAVRVHDHKKNKFIRCDCAIARDYMTRKDDHDSVQSR